MISGRYVRRVVLVLTVATAVAAAATVVSQGTRESPAVTLCTTGRFLLAADADTRSRTGPIKSVSLFEGRASLDPWCGPVPVRLSLDPRGNTRLVARWTSCRSLPRGSQLVAAIDGATCSTLAGELRTPDLRGATRVSGALAQCAEFRRDGRLNDCVPLDRHALWRQRARTILGARAYPLRGQWKGSLTSAIRQIGVARLDPDVWVNLGPAPIESGDKRWSGRVDAVAADPSNALHWLIGAATGGVWETFDGGQTWLARTDAQPTLAMSAIAFAPAHPTRVYAGTGEYDPHGGTYPGQGILRSSDGGATWTLVGTGTLEELTPAAIRVSPSDPDRLVVAALDRLGPILEGLAPEPASPAGIYESGDAGVTWDLQLQGHATDVVVHPSAFGWRYAGLRSDLFGLGPSGIFRTLDGGVSWEKIAGPWNMPPHEASEIKLAVAPSQPDTVYVSVRGGGNEYDLLIGLFRSDNAWAPQPTWSKIPVTGLESLGSKGAYVRGYFVGMSTHQIIVDPVDPGIVFATGIELWRFANGLWTAVSGKIHGDQRALAWTGPRLLVGNDGGVYSQGPDEPFWTNHNTNLSITQFWAGARASDSAGHLLGGAQDNGILVRKPGPPASWSLMYGGDGMAALAGDVPQQWFSSLQWVNLVRGLSDAGPFQGTGFDITDKASPFWVPAARCAANGNLVLVGAKRVWRSTNFFSAPTAKTIAFSAISSPLGSLDNAFVDIVNAVAVAPSDPNCLTYAYGSDKGLLRLTTDGGAHWQDLDAGNAVPDRAVTGLAFSPTSASTLYVTLSGIDAGTPGQPGHLFRTSSATSAAPIWQNVGPPVDIPHLTVALGLAGSSSIYVGTDLGLWISHDNAATWALAPPEKGMPRVPVTKIEVDPCGVTAFTFGRGVIRKAASLFCQ